MKNILHHQYSFLPFSFGLLAGLLRVGFHHLVPAYAEMIHPLIRQIELATHHLLQHPLDIYCPLF